MCSSMVVVEDTSPPYSKICPSGIVRHSQLNRQFPFDPRFQDNTGISSIDVSGLPGTSKRSRLKLYDLKTKIK